MVNAAEGTVGSAQRMLAAEGFGYLRREATEHWSAFDDHTVGRLFSLIRWRLPSR